MEIKEKEIINVVLDELARRGLLRRTENLRDKTKDLLKNFKRLDGAIKHYRKEIKNLEDSKDTNSGGIRTRLTYQYSDTSIHSTVDESSLEVIDSRISNLEQRVLKIESFKKLVNEIIDEKLSKDDADIIRQVYFDKVDADDIAVELDCDKSTIYRRITKAIDEIKIELFANDFIDQMS